MKRLLLVLLGNQPYEKAVEYQLSPDAGSNQSKYITPFPVAAVVEQWKRSSFNQLPDDPTSHDSPFDRILVVTTPEVKEAYPDFQPGLMDLLRSWTHAEEIELLEVSQAEAQPMDLQRKLNDQLGDQPIDVVADLSGLSKDFAIIIPSILRQRSVMGQGSARIYCASPASRSGEERKFKVVDLNPLDELTSFHSAVYQLLDTGHSRSLIQQLKLIHERIKEDCKGWIMSFPQEQRGKKGNQNPLKDEESLIKCFIDILEQYSEQFLSGMVMGSLNWNHDSEKIIQGSKFLKNRAPEWSNALDLLCNQIEETIQEFPTTDQPLDLREYQRQIRFAKKLIDYRSIGPALQILRECATSRVLIEREGFGSFDWLKHNLRKHCNNFLTSAIKANEGSKNSDDNLNRLNELGQARNTIAHSAFKSDPQTASTLVKKWQSESESLSAIENLLLGSDSFWRDHFSRPNVTGDWLVTPLGMSPGTVFTFLEHYLDKAPSPPDGLVILTSAQGAERIPEILAKVNWKQRIPSLQIHVVQIGGDDQDLWSTPLNLDVRKIKTVEGLCVADLLAGASRINCNLTGGTSSLCILADRLVREMSSPDIEVRWQICVDRRSYQEQQAAPFVKGEVRNVK